MSTRNHLWEPVNVGTLRLSHRLALSPMTRSRAQADGTPGALAAEYYAQRASLGLLITEGVQPSEDGQGYLATPGIFTDSHIAGWRAVTDAVHAEGAGLFVQLMHVGRISHPDNTPHHRQPVAPSAIASGTMIHTMHASQPTATPRALRAEEIRTTIDDYRRAAAAAMEAGADGVEIHGANGYLIHQFLSPNANARTDGYGGSIEARSRFAVDVASAVVAEIGAEHSGIRLSPGLQIGGIDEGEQYAAQYTHLIGELAELDLAYLNLFHLGDDDFLREVRKLWPNALLLLRAGRTRDDLDADIAAGVADVVPLGRWALANPDIVDRLRRGSELNEPDPQTFYGGGAVGYTDYPLLRA